MKKITAKGFLIKLKEYALVTFAAILNAISLYTFVNPNHLIAGGFSGLSSALTYIVDPLIPSMGYDELMSIVYIIINIPLLICSLIFLRGDFTFKTIWSTIVCTAALAVLAYLPDLKFDHSRLIAIIFGGILIGLAMYIAYEQNGSNGGTEIIARIVSKYHPEIDLSKVLLISNFIITFGGSIIVMWKVGADIAIVIYSITYVIIGSTSMGMLKRGFNHPQKFMIVTTEYEQIASDITRYFKRGCTCMDVVNSDPNAPPRKVVMVIIQYRQRKHLRALIKNRDPHAFTFVKDVNDIFSRPTFNRSYKL
ncbi:MAG: YitT family protein [Clostridiales bacterium]|nr:YitT family protein [Clostridiales bacterium]